MRPTLLFLFPALLLAQGRGGDQPSAPAPQPAKASAPIDLTGYWVSLVVDEWRFRVSPQKGDVPYLPLNAAARQIANTWDPDRDLADGKACKAYGAVGVMQRPGRLHVTWDDDNTIRVDADAGMQTRTFHFGDGQGSKGDSSWQGYSVAQWVRPGGRNAQPKSGQLKVVTTNMLSGYVRKNGVPYSANAVLTEYFNRLEGAQGDVYISVTAMLDDPTYLTQPFVRSYQFKRQPDASGWDPTPCLPR